MRTLELFSGAGLATEGLIAAGLDVVRCVEWDADADATAKAAGHPSIRGDIRASEVYEGLGVIGLVWASFPCQAWSTAGKREGASDERNGWPWVMDAVDFLRAGAGGPGWLICENVPGLTYHSAKVHENGPPVDPGSCPACYFDRVILVQARERFASVQWTILDAADVGVPQRRHRVFIVCGPRPIAWPMPTHADPSCPECDGKGDGATGLFGRLPCRPCAGTGRSDAVRVGGLAPWRTVRQALGLGVATPACDTGGGGNPHGPGREYERTERDLTDEPGLTVSVNDAGNGGMWLEVPNSNRGRGRAVPARSLDDPSPAVCGQEGTGISLAGRGNLPQWHRPMDADRPADTIQGSGSDGGGPRPPGILDDTPRTIPQTRPDWSHRATGLDTPTRAIGTRANASVRGVSLGPEERKTYPKGLGRAASEPAPTVATTEEKGTRASAASGYTFNGGPDRASDAAFLGAGIRRLTVLECAALQSMPPDYPWTGTKTAQYRQVGNGVPPPLAEAVARSVLSAANALP